MLTKEERRLINELKKRVINKYETSSPKNGKYGYKKQMTWRLIEIIERLQK